jgi:DNA-binding transcriptional LysR family regulator
MHRRYEHVNIPIEIIRTLVSIVETASFSKTGTLLGLSQPAITAQMKRLQMIVGGAVFERGTALTPLGLLVLSHARKILEANDQILSLGGATGETQLVRMGLSAIYASGFFKIVTSNGARDQLTFFCGHSPEIAKSVDGGYLDVACLFNPSEAHDDLIDEWSEDLVWVRSRDFVLSPGSAIPIATWPGRPEDQPAIQALEKHGLAYRIAFASYDYCSRVEAAAAGICLKVMPERLVTEPLVVAKDYYLPPLRPLRAGIRVRNGVPTSKTDWVVKLLRKRAPDKSAPETATIHTHQN